MRANREDLAHVLDNLLDNALRYSPPGTKVRVETDIDGDRALLIVSDSGPGMSPEDRPRVFERFYRGASGRRAGHGTGLGLAIVAEHVRRWGARSGSARGQGRVWRWSFYGCLPNLDQALAESWHEGW